MRYRYESEHNDTIPHHKSGGQLGSAQTSVDKQPEAAAQQTAERGAKTAENIRYGQSISEGEMGGMTNQEGEVKKEGYGRLEEQVGETSGAGESRRAQGYGGKEDMDREIGA